MQVVTRLSGLELGLAGGILDVEASHLAVSKAEDVFNRLVLQPVVWP